MNTNLASLKTAVGLGRKGSNRKIHAPQSQEEALFRQELQRTMDAWRHAENHFREATDQDLIDQASYDLLAAKSRYAYLLKQARLRGLSL